MASQQDERGNFQNNHSKGKWHTIRLIPLAEGLKEQQDGLARDDHESWHASVAISILPNISWDEVNTKVNLDAIGQSSLFPDFDNVEHSPSLNQQSESIPAIQASNRNRKLEAKDSGKESYVSLIRNLSKNSGIYAVTSLVSPLISIVLAPYLTHNLSHPAYGALVVLYTVITLLAALTQLGLNAAFFRSYNYDYESHEDRLGVLSSVVALISFTSVCTTLTMLLTAPWISMLLFDSITYSDAVRAAALVLLIQNLTVPGLAWLRAENHALFFVLLSIANLVFTLVCTIVLVGILHMEIVGALIASAIGYALIVICTLPIILLRAGLRLRFDIARGMLSFGLPMVFSIVSVWVLQLSDRFLLSRLGSLTQTASYSVAYTLGSAVSVVILSPFTLAWPSALFTIARNDRASYIYMLVFRWFSMILLLGAFAFSIVSIVALYLLFPPTYHSAAPIIPVIVMSTVFYGIYNIFTTGISIRRKTWFFAVFTVISALTNVVFNLILIPLYGSMGAAISTLLSYILLAFISYVVNQRLYSIPYEIAIFVIELLVGVAVFFGSYKLAPSGQGNYTSWCIWLGVSALYGGFLLLIGLRLSKSRKVV